MRTICPEYTTSNGGYATARDLKGNVMRKRLLSSVVGNTPPHLFMSVAVDRFTHRGLKPIHPGRSRTSPAPMRCTRSFLPSRGRQ
jgi:hypothetical protein